MTTSSLTAAAERGAKLKSRQVRLTTPRAPKAISRSIPIKGSPRSTPSPTSQGKTSRSSLPTTSTSSPTSSEDIRRDLVLMGRSHVELYGVKQAAANRRGVLVEADKKKEKMLRCLPALPDPAPAARSIIILDGIIKATDHELDQVKKEITRLVKRHPLGPWVASMSGVGEVSVGRLLGLVGDAYWNFSTDSPRTVSQLWAYCGLHVVAGRAPRRQKGVQSNWNTEAKTILYLLAEIAMKQVGGVKSNGTKKPLSPYRAVYDEAREKISGSLHAYDCPRCGVCSTCGGPLDKNHEEHETARGCVNRKVAPAVVGTPLSPAHQEARALRVVSKAILKDLWIESRRIHLEGAT